MLLIFFDWGKAKIAWAIIWSGEGWHETFFFLLSCVIRFLSGLSIVGAQASNVCIILFYVFSWSLGFTTRTTSSFVRFLVLVSYDPPVQTVAVGFPENKN